MSQHPKTMAVDAFDVERDLRTLGRGTRTLLQMVGRRLWNVEVESPTSVPALGPAIIAANHISFFDSVALMMTIPRPLSFVGKAEYMESWKTRHLLPAFGMIPIDRASGFRAWGSNRRSRSGSCRRRKVTSRGW